MTTSISAGETVNRYRKARMMAEVAVKTAVEREVMDPRPLLEPEHHILYLDMCW